LIAKTQTLRFLIDHNVPDSVGTALDELGHDVVRLRNVMAVNTSDPVVARAAIEDKRILVGWDRNFNQQRFMSPRFEGLGRLAMSGPEMEEARRIHQTNDLIVFAVQRVQPRPIIIRVSVEKVLIHS